MKQQRKELLTFYKKHKKYELQEAQIENQKAVLEKLQSQYNRQTTSGPLETEQTESHLAPYSADLAQMPPKGSEILHNAAFFKDQQMIRL